LPDWQRRPILALTANAFDDDRQGCAEAGMDDFIIKSIDVSRLYEILLHWLNAESSPPGETRGALVPPTL
jgi:CheY-like chemotaxis protein